MAERIAIFIIIYILTFCPDSSDATGEDSEEEGGENVQVSLGMWNFIICSMHVLISFLDKKRSLSHEFAAIEKKAKKSVTLAAAPNFQDCFVDITPLLIPESIVDKRMNNNLGHYEYLVKFEATSKLYNAWLAPKDIHKPQLIAAYEKARQAEISHQQHPISWYPFGEQFAVQWKTHPYFVVSYGAGQFNKFCIVGLDKTGQELKCKHTKNKNNPRHRVHLNMVAALMKSKDLVIHNSKIMSAASAATIPMHTPVSSKPFFPKPLSSSQISIFPSPEIQKLLVQQITDPASIPIEFKPTTHPEWCKCTLPDGTLGKYKSVSEPMPTTRPCKVWLLHGPPLLHRKVYYWRCMQNNPACDVFYDGAADGYLAYSSGTIVSHAVPMDFIFQLVTGKGASFSGFVAHKELMNELCFGCTASPLYLQKKGFVEVCHCK